MQLKAKGGGGSLELKTPFELKGEPLPRETASKPERNISRLALTLTLQLLGLRHRRHTALSTWQKSKSFVSALPSHHPAWSSGDGGCRPRNTRAHLQRRQRPSGGAARGGVRGAQHERDGHGADAERHEILGALHLRGTPSHHPRDSTQGSHAKLIERCS